MCRTLHIAANLLPLKKYLRPGTTITKSEIINLYRQHTKNKRNLQLILMLEFEMLIYTEDEEMILL